MDQQQISTTAQQIIDAGIGEFCHLDLGDGELGEVLAQVVAAFAISAEDVDQFLVQFKRRLDVELVGEAE